MKSLKDKVKRFLSNQRGNVATKVAGMLLMGLMTLMLMIEVIPSIEALVTTGITDTTVSSLLDLAIWVLPVAGVLGLFYWIFRKFKG